MRRSGARWPDAWNGHGPFEPYRRRHYRRWWTPGRLLVLLVILPWALMIAAWLAVAEVVLR